MEELNLFIIACLKIINAIYGTDLPNKNIAITAFMLYLWVYLYIVYWKQLWEVMIQKKRSILYANVRLQTIFGWYCFYLLKILLFSILVIVVLFDIYYKHYITTATRVKSVIVIGHENLKATHFFPLLFYKIIYVRSGFPTFH